MPPLLTLIRKGLLFFLLQWTNSIRSVTLLPMTKCCRCFSEKPQHSFSGKNDVKPEWPLSVFLLTPSPALAEADQNPSVSHNEIRETCGFALILYIHLFPRTGAGMSGPGRIAAPVQLGWSISGTKTRPDLQSLTFNHWRGHDSYQDSSANGGTGLQLLSHAHFL